MSTQKHRKPRKTSKRFRRTRSKRQRGGTITNDKLIQATKDGDIDAVRNLIDEEGASVVWPDSDGWTPIMWASRNGHTEIVTILLEEGAGVHDGIEHPFRREKMIFVPLQIAIANGHTKIVRILLEGGADVDEQYSAMPENTPLAEAVSRGYTEIVTILLEWGADKDATNFLGQTALDIAIENGHNDIVELLRGKELEAPPCMSQADFDTCTKDRDGNPQCGIMMTELTRENAVRTHPPPPHKEGEEPNTTDCFDRESLRRWLKNTKENPITKLPVEQNWIDANMGEKDCEPQTESAPETVFNSPSTGGKRKSKRKTRKSKRKTRKTRKPTKYKKRFRKTRSKRQRGGGELEDNLYKAINDHNLDKVIEVLDAGADINAKINNSNGEAALAVASFSGHADIVAKLLERGADVNAIDNNGSTALFGASVSIDIGRGEPEVVAMLLDAGADVNVKKPDGRTALQMASWYGHPEVVAILLEQPGIDVNAQDNRGNTALQHAINKGHNDIVELLRGKELEAPPCMSQADFDTCTKDGDGIPQCGIMMTELTRENAVRTHPPQPHKEGEEPNTTDCFDRENLRRWLRNTKENPITKLPVEQDWINANMADRDCEPQTETVFNSPSTGGKRKTNKSKRKTNKSKRKSKKSKRKNRKTCKK